MPDLRIKIEQDDSGKVEATVETFDVSANYNDAVTIYNDANAGGIAFKPIFPFPHGLPPDVACESSQRERPPGFAGAAPRV